MTVLDSSAVIDFLLGLEAAPAVEEILTTEGEAAAPDLLVFEVLAVIRRDALRDVIGAERATAAITDLADLSVALFATLPLSPRAWELRANLSAADALFVALAEALAEPLATKDRGLGRAAVEHADVEVIVL